MIICKLRAMELGNPDRRKTRWQTLIQVLDPLIQVLDPSWIRVLMNSVDMIWVPIKFSRFAFSRFRVLFHSSSFVRVEFSSFDNDTVYLIVLSICFRLDLLLFVRSNVWMEMKNLSIGGSPSSCLTCKSKDTDARIKGKILRLFSILFCSVQLFVFPPRFIHFEKRGGG